MKKLIFCLFFIQLFICMIFSQKDFSEKQISILNEQEGTKLQGTPAVPSKESQSPAVVLIYGSGAHNRDLEIFQHKPFKNVSNHLAANGVAVLRYDKRGCGKSKGNYVPYDMENFTNDALAGVEFLKQHPNIDDEQIGMIGLSQGGLVAPMAAVKSSDVIFIVMPAGPGICGKELFYTSQPAMTRAAGFSETEIAEMIKVFDD